MKYSTRILLLILVLLFGFRLKTKWMEDRCQPTKLSDGVYHIKQGCKLPEGFTPEDQSEWRPAYD